MFGKFYKDPKLYLVIIKKPEKDINAWIIKIIP